jgi:uncharacterized membrane protein YGL010W
VSVSGINPFLMDDLSASPGVLWSDRLFLIECLLFRLSFTNTVLAEVEVEVKVMEEKLLKDKSDG